MSQKGFAPVVVIILVALVLVVGAMFLLGPKDKGPKFPRYKAITPPGGDLQP